MEITISIWLMYGICIISLLAIWLSHINGFKAGWKARIKYEIENEDN